MPDGYGILSRHLTDIKFHDEPARAYTDEYTGAYQDGKRHGEWREKEIFFDNTQFTDKISAGEYVGGKKHGEWKTEGHTRLSANDTEFHASVTTTFVDGKRHGKWSGKQRMTSYDNTQLREEISAGLFVDGKEHGEWKTEGHTTFSDSDLELRDSVITTYAHGKFHGPHKYSSTSFFPPENRYTSGVEGQHVDGKRHGRWSSRYYHIDGKKDALNTWCREYSNGEIVSEKEGEGC